MFRVQATAMKKKSGLVVTCERHRGYVLLLVHFCPIPIIIIFFFFFLFFINNNKMAIAISIAITMNGSASLRKCMQMLREFLIAELWLCHC